MLNSRSHGDGIVELNLARPPANAIDPELSGQLRRTIEAAPGSGAAALVVSGGDGIFSAGLDVPALLELDFDAMRAFWTGFFELLHTIGRSSVPVCFAITGHSPAGGAVMALFGDYRIMADGPYRIGYNEVRVGIPLPDVIRRALVYLVGARQAERLGVAGLLIGSEEALRIGVVDEVVPPADVVERSIQWCRDLLRLPAHAVSDTRRRSRAELLRAFESVDPVFVEELTRTWFSEETQAALRRLVTRLNEKAPT